MDVLRWGAAGVLAAVFVGSLVVHNQPASAVAAQPLPPICGDTDAGQDDAHAGHGGHADHGDLSMQEQIDTMSATAEAHAALFQTMEPMHSDMMRGMAAEDFEVAFVCGMIPHHQGAVAMAEVAQQYGTDPWITMFAQAIITTQQTEIREMQAWLSRKQAAAQ